MSFESDQQSFEQTFDDLNTRFKSKVSQYDEHLSYSILGSPLKECKTLLVGSNWGGEESIESQKHMPKKSDLTGYSSVPTYSGYLRFFEKVFNHDSQRARRFLSDIVYTNGNFVRTPNEKSWKSQDKLRFGFNLTIPFLLEIVKIVKCDTIICFGNNRKKSKWPATRAVLKALGLHEFIHEIQRVKNCKTAGNMNSYYLKVAHEGRDYDLFSFPHSSKLGLWQSKIEDNPNFRKLRGLITD